MTKSDETCMVSGRYSAYGPCGHVTQRIIISGEIFPKCSTCGQFIAWALLHETDAWGDYQYQGDAPDSRYGGMTINERLWETNLMDEFEAARNLRDRERMIALLQKVGVSLPAAERCVNTVVAR